MHNNNSMKKLIFIAVLAALTFSSTPLEGQTLETRQAEEPVAATVNQFPATPSRKLEQIKVEEIGQPKPKAKKAQVKKSRKVKLATNQNPVIRKIDRLIKTFGLDQDLDKQKVNQYFRGLEKKIYRNLKQSLDKQKDYLKGYDELLKDYAIVAAKYEIK